MYNSFSFGLYIIVTEIRLVWCDSPDKFYVSRTSDKTENPNKKLHKYQLAHFKNIKLLISF